MVRVVEHDLFGRPNENYLLHVFNDTLAHTFCIGAKCNGIIPYRR
jgi:hypothetical protein